MRPLSEFHGSRIDGLLFDLDDTLLTHGVLTREAYDALWDLHDAGLVLVAVTGRPARWGDFIAMQWPIAGAVTENGAIAAIREERRIVRIDHCDPQEREFRRERLRSVVAAMAARAPDLKPTSDVGGRVTDVTWDIGENEHVTPERIAFAESVLAEHGARSSCSSVHLHATFDTDDKATGAVRLLTERFGVDAGTARYRYAFVGDSGNDRACFAAFANTFGVANVRASLGTLRATPRWVAPSPMGAGFAEVARALLAADRTKMR